MGLFSDAQLDKINNAAKKSNASLKSTKKVSSDSINKELNESSNAVLEYFSDAKSILITSEEQLHDYISNCIDAGIVGIDTETTGLDRIKDTIVGCSLYYPGGIECYIPNKHLVPLFDEPYKDQLTYEQTAKELQRLVDNNVKLIFANADFDLSMIYKDYHVDLCDVCYYDVIIAWRCIKEDEKKNGLKELYNKYVLKGKGEPMKFSDFFSPKLFPYCKPQIAKLYAANDAKITYELCMWQMPYITKGNKKCEKKHLEHIADLVWNIEFPLIKVCQKMHRTGSYLDKETAQVLNVRYDEQLQKESDILADMVQDVIDNQPYIPDEISKRPFKSGKDFKPNSNPQVSYLLYKMMNLTPPPSGNGKNNTKNESTSKSVLQQFNLPITDQILKVRSLDTLISTFVKKMPNTTTSDSRIHAEFKQIGADCVTGDTLIVILVDEVIAEIPIKEIYDNCDTDVVAEHIDISGINVINRYNQVEKASSIVKYEDYATIKITLENGYKLEGTYNHPVLIYTDDGDVFKKLQDIQLEDEVAIYSGDDIYYKSVIGIEYGRADVYDLYVPVTHSFVSNGIISHNTGRFSSASPNLQNIPSHADDIRHMFRATPETHQEVEVEFDEDNKIKIEVSYYDKVYNEKNELVVVHDLQVGDFIKAQNNNEDIVLQIESITDTKSDLSRCNIVLVSTIDNLEISKNCKIIIQTPAYVMLSSDFSQQEPRLTAFISQDPKMISAYQEGKDIYATIASISMNIPYEECLEFNPKTHEVQKEGKRRRTEAKSIVLGILYGRSTKTIGDQLYGSNIRADMSEKEKQDQIQENTKKAQGVYDSVLNAFPNLKQFMNNAQWQASHYGYTETILGRRRYIPDMTLSKYGFAAMRGYVNPDIDPLDPDTLEDKSLIPERIIYELNQEFSGYKYQWQVVKRTKELAEQKIKVINNTRKITDATRQCVNCVDDKTEILTDRGWLTYDEVKVGDSIISYDTNSKTLNHDTIQLVHINKGEQEVYTFNNDDIDAISTLDHRWVWADKYDTNIKKFVKTSDILHHFDEGISKVSSQNIIRTMANVCIYGNDKISDDMLAIVGWICFNEIENKTISYGHFTSTTTYNPTNIYVQNIDKISKEETKYTSFIRANFEYLETSDAFYYDDSMDCHVVNTKLINIPKFNHLFISSLSQIQARLLYNSIEEFSGLNIRLRDSDILSDFERSIICKDNEQVDLIQHLLLQCGQSSYVQRLTEEQKKTIDILNKYDNLYAVFQSNVKNVEIQEEDIKPTKVNLTWCVTTGNGTWIARRNGKVYITGNSIVQGSAADLTKMAILNLCNNEEWQRLGGRLLTPIHDELLCEIPMENWERGGEVLTNCMCEAADFLPFKITCDVETTVRWYGNAYPIEYLKPEHFPTENPEEIKWIQWCLLEMEYILPVYKDKDGNTPLGAEGRGINGKISEEYNKAIRDYMERFHVTEDTFIEHIGNHAIYGYIE